MSKIALAVPLVVIITVFLLPFGRSIGDTPEVKNTVAPAHPQFENRALARLAMKNESLRAENEKLSQRIVAIEQKSPSQMGDAALQQVFERNTSLRKQLKDATAQLVSLETQVSNKQQDALAAGQEQKKTWEEGFQKMEREMGELNEKLAALENENQTLRTTTRESDQLRLRLLDMEKALADARKSALPNGQAAVVETGANKRVDAKADIVSVARTGLNAFLNATNVDQRLAHCLNPDKIRELASIYYRVNDAGPIDISSVIFRERAPIFETDYHVCIFEVSTPNIPDGFPVAVEQTDRGMKVDWETFIEFSQNKLATFLEEASVGKQETFHLVIERAHYFTSDVPNVDQKYAYQIYSPVNGSFPSHVFASKSGEIGSRLDKILNWNQTYMFVVDLRWKQEGKVKPYLDLVRVRSFNWR